MPRNRQQPNRRKKTVTDAPNEVNVPSDSELFASPVNSAPAYSDIFASLLDLASDPQGSANPTVSRNHRTAAPWIPFSARTLSLLQKGLTVGIIAVAAMLVYSIVGRLSSSPPDLVEAPSHPATEGSSTTETPAYDLPPSPSIAEPNTQARKGELNVPALEPLSLRVADRLYLSGDFENALMTYDKLYRRLPPSEAHQVLRDFLLFRMAMCYKNAGDTSQADSLFRTVSLSRLAILRALARYHQSVVLIERGRYLEAAAKAYQTTALIEVVDYDKEWVQAVQRQCSFLIAEAFTRHLLSLRDGDVDLPAMLWLSYPDIDPFLNLDEPQLKVFLTSGTDKFNEALLSPQISAAMETDRWSVICNGASIEELLARFAANSHLNIQWVDGSAGSLDEETVRRRPVYMYVTSSTAQQILAIAAGSVGLTARVDDQKNVSISDPSSYTSLTDHTTQLNSECISLWHSFLLTAEDDKRTPNAHFALGLLHSVRDRPDEAIAEYRLVASRFPKDPLAPHALLLSGKLKIALRDYPGAQKDLRQLADLYPDVPLSDQALLYLADASMRVGAHDDAVDLYRKVYHLGLSVESQTESALGAGRSLYEMHDYEEAAKWLSRYIDLAKNQNRREFHATCLLLGKVYLELQDPKQAHALLKLALQGDLSRQQHVETIATLVKAYMQQNLLLEALNTLETTYTWQLSQEESMGLLLLRAEVFRSMGLIDKAISTLRERGQFLPNPELKARIAMELAGCYSDIGQYEQARATLSDTLAGLPAGPLAGKIGCELAKVCLQVGQAEQAISVCTQLLPTLDGAQRKDALGVIAKAYRQQKEYNLAVSALVDSPNSPTADPDSENVSR
jgi:tetratricopeptide (TPR) repeat protein